MGLRGECIAERSHLVRTAICRGIVYDDDLLDGVFLGIHCRQTIRNVICAIIGHDMYAYCFVVNIVIHKYPQYPRIPASNILLIIPKTRTSGYAVLRENIP
ncbi:hypothetical protein D3C73_1019250 [compost metagenome]